MYTPVDLRMPSPGAGNFNSRPFNPRPRTIMRPEVPQTQKLAKKRVQGMVGKRYRNEDVLILHATVEDVVIPDATDEAGPTT